MPKILGEIIEMNVIIKEVKVKGLNYLIYPFG